METKYDKNGSGEVINVEGSENFNTLYNVNNDKVDQYNNLFGQQVDSLKQEENGLGKVVNELTDSTKEVKSVNKQVNDHNKKLSKVDYAQALGEAYKTIEGAYENINSQLLGAHNEINKYGAAIEKNFENTLNQIYSSKSNRFVGAMKGVGKGFNALGKGVVYLGKRTANLTKKAIEGGKDLYDKMTFNRRGERENNQYNN